MPRYFFDLYENGVVRSDADGLELDNIEQVRLEAMAFLPAVAKDEVPHDGDRQSFSVHVRDNQGRSVYMSTLTYVGLSFSRGSEAP